MSLPSNVTVPCARLEQPGDRLQGRRLAGAVGADQRDDLAAADLERHALQRVDVAVVGVDVLELEDRLAGPPASGGAPARERRRRSYAGVPR